MFSFARYLSAAAIAGIASAQTPDEIAKYPIIAEYCDHYNLTWESFPLVTEDGYHLALFHLTGYKDKGPFEITKPPLMAVPPMM